MHSLCTVNWSVGTDCFSFREMHVNFCWMLVISLRHFQREVIFSEKTAFRKWSKTPFTSHSELKGWNRLLLFQRNACEFLVNSYNYLKALSKKVIFSEITAFRKWSNTPFTLHSELKCWNRLLLFQRNACEFLVNAFNQLKALSKNVIFSESTEFRKWRNTPFTLHSELKCGNRLLFFQRNSCELLVNAGK